MGDHPTAKEFHMAMAGNLDTYGYKWTPMAIAPFVNYWIAAESEPDFGGIKYPL